MERDSRVLAAATEEYRLDVNGVKFWTPYWINWPTPPYHLGAPYAGKGTPGQLRNVLLSQIQKTSRHPKTSKGYRSLMRQMGLGVDCSGLAYDLLSRLLRQNYRLKLSDHIFTPKADIIEASHRPRWSRAGVSEKTLSSLPDYTSVAEVHRLFHVNQKWITNVERLTSRRAAVTVSKVKDVRPGDMIKMTGSSGDHIGVIVRLGEDQLEYYDSRESSGGIGGVRLITAKLSRPSRGLEDQDWVDRADFNPKIGDRICRLKVLDGAV